MSRIGKSWHAPDPRWARRYDEAWQRVREVLGENNRIASYDRIAALLFQHTGHSVVGQTIRRWQKEGTLPVHWGTSLVDLVAAQDPDERVTIFDFFPYLVDYIDEGFLE